MSDLPLKLKEIDLGQEKIVLDPSKLLLNESNLGQFMDELAVWYNYFTQKTAEAEYLWSQYETQYETVYNDAFKRFKDEGKSDKFAEASAKNSVEVQETRKVADKAKLRVNELKSHVRSWDKAHDCAQNRGHTLRKEMDKLNLDLGRKVEELLNE